MFELSETPALENPSQNLAVKLSQINSSHNLVNIPKTKGNFQTLFF